MLPFKVFEFDTDTAESFEGGSKSKRQNTDDAKYNRKAKPVGFLQGILNSNSG